VLALLALLTIFILQFPGEIGFPVFFLGAENFYKWLLVSIILKVKWLFVYEWKK
jgi:hypothetical protein